ncbi:YARHG domain-containing protein [Eubacterium sp. MSJ-13]|uniref:YARHG domain-containing protein n=1 Tax=Eubacterium sp. MSJ-13 TaxID=2841513 RepID=UPI001C10ACA8|nr:YARHG domain-containing protein [Eubacterium sp. MSJ-13]MBU5478553.1 YARHG domain-containing protein [Eubacterium sp. MSJ-13]
MSGIIAIIIFVLSIVITHMICSRYIYIGTTDWIISKKITVWVIVFMTLLVIASKLNLVKTPDTSDDKDNKKITQREINEYKKELKKQMKNDESEVTSEDSSEDLDDYDDSYNDSDDSAGNGYILPDSSKRKLKKSDLKGLSKEELRIARNEIYARHGRRFNDKELQKYFDNQSWYEGTVAADDFSEDALNSIEKKNAAFIKQFE